MQNICAVTASQQMETVTAKATLHLERDPENNENCSNGSKITPAELLVLKGRMPME